MDAGHLKLNWSDSYSKNGGYEQKMKPKYTLHYTHLPSWLHDNHFLHSSHRPPLNSYWACFRSMFSIHSETGNIWSHFIGFKVFVYLTFSFWTSASTPVQEKWIFTLFFLGAIICLGCSTLYHVLHCHSKGVCGVVLKLDYCGISFMNLTFYPWYYYGFHCATTARNAYFILSGSIVLGCVCITAMDTFAQRKYWALRAVAFIGSGLSHAVPTLHFMILNGFDHPVSKMSSQWLSLVTLVMLTSALVYGTRVPERWMPGKCDILFHSHQIFHILVVVGVVANYLGVSEVSLYRASHGPICGLE